jgi:hypothetical protein
LRARYRDHAKHRQTDRKRRAKMMAPIYALRELGWLDGYEILDEPILRPEPLIAMSWGARYAPCCGRARPRQLKVAVPIKQRAQSLRAKKRALLAALQEIGWIDANYNVIEVPTRGL